MKVLIIRNYPSFMDVENNTYNIQEVGLAKALVRIGYECGIIFWTDKEEKVVDIEVENKKFVRVYYKKGTTFLKNTMFLNCSDIFDSYDILQPVEYNQIQAWYLSMKYPKKTVIYHGPYYSKFNKKYNIMCKMFDIIFLKYYIKKGTKFIVKSSLAKKFLIEKGIKDEYITLSGVGMDIEMLRNKNNSCNEILYNKMAKDDSDLKLLYIGRFEERRNIYFILDVFKKLCKQKKNAKLYMIGTGDKEYLKKIWDYAERINIKEDIIWQEKMEQKYLSYIYKMSDFFVLPTEYEIFGMVLLEAMYYENVVLTTYNGGSSTLIENGKNGFILENMNSEIWADKIIEVYENKNLTESVKKNAYKRISENYTWDSLAHIFKSVYDKI